MGIPLWEHFYVIQFMASYKGIGKKWDLIKYALKKMALPSCWVEIHLNSILGSLKVK